MRALAALVLVSVSPALAQEAPVEEAPVVEEPVAVPMPVPVVIEKPVEGAKPAPTVALKFGKGITLESEDGREKLEIRGRVQLRFTQVSEDGGDPPNATEFQARRIRLNLKGHVWGGDLTYNLQLAFSNLDNEPDLRSPTRDAYMTYTKLRDLNIRWGQMKVPFGKQRVVSSSAQSFVDRSIVTGELNLDRDVGIQAMSEDLGGFDGLLAYNLGVFHGDGRNRLTTTPGVLVAGRFVVRPFGAFDDMKEADHDRVTTPKLAIAVNAAYNDNSKRARSTFTETYQVARFDYRHAAVDLVFKYRGFQLQSELLYRKADRESFQGTLPDGTSITERSRNGWGYYVQSGYLFTKQVELAARVGDVRPIGDDGAFTGWEREYGGTLNYYVEKHDLKLQADYFLLTKEDSDARHQIRVQTQIYF